MNFVGERNERLKPLVQLMILRGHEFLTDPLITINSQPLWEVCLDMPTMVDIARSSLLRQMKYDADTFLQQSPFASQSISDADWIRRQILLEFSITVESSRVASNYIQARVDGLCSTNRNAPPTYVLQDVGRVQKWADDFSAYVENRARTLLMDAVVSALLGEDDRYSTVIETLSSIVTTTRGLSNVYRALRARKEVDIEELRAGAGASMTNDTPDFVLAEQSTYIEILHKKYADLECLARCIELAMTCCQHTDVLHFRDFIVTTCDDRRNVDSPYLQRLASRSPECDPKMGSHFLTPEVLCTRSILDTLCDCVFQSIGSETHFFSIFSYLDVHVNNSTALNDNTLEAMATNFLVHLFLAPLSVIRKHVSGGGSASIESLTIVDMAFEIVIFLVLDTTHVDFAAVEDRMAINALARALGNACGLGFSSTLRLYALWRIEAVVDIANAVRDLRGDRVDPSRDPSVLIAALRKLITMGHMNTALQPFGIPSSSSVSPSSSRQALYGAAQLTRFLGFDTTVLSHGAGMQVRSCDLMWKNLPGSDVCLGPIALLASSLTGAESSADKFDWKNAWDEARNSVAEKCVDCGASAIVRSRTRRALAFVMIRWAAVCGPAGCFSDVLESHMDVEEMVEVAQLLHSMAKTEIFACTEGGPEECPRVDLFVSWLLRHNLHKQARQIHNEHIQGLATKMLAGGAQANFSEELQAECAMIIEASPSLSKRQHLIDGRSHIAQCSSDLLWTNCST